MQRLIAIIFAVLFTGACHTLSAKDKTVADSMMGKTIYNRVGLHGESKGSQVVVQSAGYIGLPVHFAPNTAFRLVEMNADTMVLKRGSESVLLKFNAKHSQMSIGDYVKATFSNSKIPEKESYSELEKKNIDQGTVEVGMRKSAIFKAVGKPPRSLTPSIKGDTLVYAKSKFNNVELRFDGQGKLVEIVD